MGPACGLERTSSWQKVADLGSSSFGSRKMAEFPDDREASLALLKARAFLLTLSFP